MRPWNIDNNGKMRLLSICIENVPVWNLQVLDGCFIDNLTTSPFSMTKIKIKSNSSFTWTYHANWWCQTRSYLNKCRFTAHWKLWNSQHSLDAHSIIQIYSHYVWMLHKIAFPTKKYFICTPKFKIPVWLKDVSVTF